MKKILFAILDVLLLVIICILLFKGFNAGTFSILSFQGIAELNENLTQKIAEANSQIEQYNDKLTVIKKDTEDLTKAKKEYLDLMTVSTDSEIQEALQTKTYSIEYLWSIVGNYATKEGVVTRMEIASSSIGDNEYKNLNFTLTGAYLSMTNFITDIENDSNLDFTIDNFDMQSKQCTFVVKDIKIKEEQTTVSDTDATGQNNQNSNGQNSNNENNNNNNNNNNGNNNNNNNNNDSNNNDSNNNSNNQNNNNNNSNNGTSNNSNENNTANNQ